MNNFVRNIKQHKLAALICFLLLAAIVAAVVVMVIKERNGAADSSSLAEVEQKAGEQSRTAEYFGDTDYPVKVTTKDGKVILDLDGSKTPDLTWQVVSDDTEQAVIKAENDGEETEGRLSTVITPVSVGYATVSCTRGSEVSGIAFNVSHIEAEVYTSIDENGNISATLSDIRQTKSLGGALDTKTPFLLDKNAIILPNGGDWTVEIILADGAPADLFRAFRDEGEGDLVRYYFEKNISAIKSDDLGEITKMLDDSKIVLKNETLGIEQQLDLTMSPEKEWVFSIHEDSEDEDSADSNADSESKSEEQSSNE